jgi:tetratricopeptide repeat protein
VDECAQGHLAAAERLQLTVLDYDRRVLGPGHPGTLLQMSNLANTYAAERRFAEAEQLLAETLDNALKAQGASSVSVVIAL